MATTLQYKGANAKRAFNSWVVPYLKSRIHADQFRPILCYLYTEYQCNIDCHYCFQYEDQRGGMPLSIAENAIDWLHSLGCRVLALMGGEPLLRKDLVLEIIRYASSRGFFVYLPTNGYLLDRAFIDEAGKAGVAAINLAVDTLAPRRGLPKALLNIEPQFRYLVERQKKYGYILFFNINICRTNLDDVKLLTEIAHQNRIGTDYHLNQKPVSLFCTDHYKHKENGLYITPDRYQAVDDLLDWIIARHRQGWPMVNHIEHLKAMKGIMRGTDGHSWECRAGQNGAFIRPDGTLAPCFDLMRSDHDWGRIGNPAFDENTLSAVKKKCMPHCASTCFYTMGCYYHLRWIPEWVRQHVRVG